MEPEEKEALLRWINATGVSPPASTLRQLAEGTFFMQAVQLIDPAQAGNITSVCSFLEHHPVYRDSHHSLTNIRSAIEHGTELDIAQVVKLILLAAVGEASRCHQRFIDAALGLPADVQTRIFTCLHEPVVESDPDSTATMEHSVGQEQHCVTELTRGRLLSDTAGCAEPGEEQGHQAPSSDSCRRERRERLAWSPPASALIAPPHCASPLELFFKSPRLTLASNARVTSARRRDERQQVASLRRLTQALEREQTRRDDLEAELRETTSRLRAAEAKYGQLERRHSQYTVDTAAELGSLQQKLEESEHELMGLRRSDPRCCISSECEQAQALRQEVSSLRNELTSLQARDRDFDALRSQHERLNVLWDQQQQHLRAVNEEAMRMRTDITEAARTRSSLQQQLDEARDECQELRSTFAAAQRFQQNTIEPSEVKQPSIAAEIRLLEMEASLEELRRTLFKAENDIEKMTDQRDSLMMQRDELAAERCQLVSEGDRLGADGDALLLRLDQLGVERDALVLQLDRLAAERDDLVHASDALVLERDQLLKATERLAKERQEVQRHAEADCTRLIGELSNMSLERDKALEQRDILAGQRDSALQQRDRMAVETNLLAAERLQLEEERDKIKMDNERTIMEAHQAVECLVKERDRALQEQDEAVTERDEALKERDRALQGRDEAVMKRDEAFKVRDRALQERDEAVMERDEALKEQYKALQERGEAVMERGEAVMERDEALKERNAALKERDEAVMERDESVKQQDKAVKERYEAVTVRDEAVRERDEAVMERDDAVKERGRAAAELIQLIEAGKQERLDNERLRHELTESLQLEASKHAIELASLSTERAELSAERDALSAEMDALLAERDKLTAERAMLSAARDTLSAKRDELSEELEHMGAQRGYLLQARIDALAECDRLFEQVQLATERERTALAKVSSEVERLVAEGQRGILDERAAAVERFNELLGEKCLLLEEQERQASEFCRLSQRIDKLVVERDELRRGQESAAVLHDELALERDRVVGNNAVLVLEKSELGLAKDELVCCKKQLEAEMEHIVGEMNALNSVHSSLMAERDRLALDNSVLAKDKDCLTEEKSELAKNVALAAEERNSLVLELENLAFQRDELLAERGVLAAERDAAVCQKSQVADAASSLAVDKEKLCEQLRALAERHDALACQNQLLVSEQASHVSEKRRLEALVSQLTAEMAEVARQQAGLEERAATLAADKFKLSAEVERVAGEKDEIAAARDGLLVEKQSLLDTRSSALEERDKLALESVRLQEEVNRLAAAERNSAATSELEAKCNDLEAARVAAESECLQLREAATETRESLTASAEKIQRLTDAHESLKKMIDNYRVYYGQKKELVKKLEEELQAEKAKVKDAQDALQQLANTQMVSKPTKADIADTVDQAAGKPSHCIQRSDGEAGAKSSKQSKALHSTPAVGTVTPHANQGSSGRHERQDGYSSPGHHFNDLSTIASPVSLSVNQRRVESLSSLSSGRTSLAFVPMHASTLAASDYMMQAAMEDTRVMELQRRNTLCLPHMRSTYAVELQDAPPAAGVAQLLPQHEERTATHRASLVRTSTAGQQVPMTASAMRKRSLASATAEEAALLMDLATASPTTQAKRRTIASVGASATRHNSALTANSATHKASVEGLLRARRETYVADPSAAGLAVQQSTENDAGVSSGRGAQKNHETFTIPLTPKQIRTKRRPLANLR